MDAMDNILAQRDELEAIVAVFGEEVTVDLTEPPFYLEASLH